MFSFPHEKRERRTHGGSPGNGMTPMDISSHPLATEGEATPGPDDVTPFDDVGDSAAMDATSPPAVDSGGPSMALPFMDREPAPTSTSVDTGVDLPSVDMPDLDLPE